MKKINKILIFLLTLAIIVVPVLSFAQEGGLVVCGKGNGPECTFNDALKMVNNVINFIFKYLVLPISAIMFAYAGFLLITAGGEAAHARTEAKEIFINVVIGLLISAGCFIIVKFFLSLLGYKFISNWFII